jgi:hypothetical protein
MNIPPLVVLPISRGVAYSGSWIFLIPATGIARYASFKQWIKVSAWSSKTEKEISMPRGDKSSYSAKQKRQAEHIEKSSEKRGYGKKRAEEIAWATVNKRDGGAKGKKKSAKRSHR